MDSCDRLGSIRRIVSSLKAELTALSDAIWAHPETAFQEKYACAALSRFLAEKGFSVEPAAGLPTAFVASRGAGSPVIGYIGPPGSPRQTPSPAAPGTAAATTFSASARRVPQRRSASIWKRTGFPAPYGFTAVPPRNPAPEKRSLRAPAYLTVWMPVLHGTRKRETAS